MRAGVRVGLFCVFMLVQGEGFISSVTAEGSEVQIWVFPSVPRAPRGVMARRAWLREFPHLPGRR